MTGLRIHFDPAIDRGAWPGLPGALLATAGEAWLGPLGLLGRLESELGLDGLQASETERATHLARALGDRAGWWRASYEADPLGTCHRLLRDRDSLVLWGWQGEAASPRLAELWQATHLALPGLPDRLRQVGAHLAGRRVDIASVVLLSPLASLPPAWLALFARLAASGVAVTEAVPERASPTGDLARARGPVFAPSGDGSLTLLRAHGPLAAADEVAASLAGLPSLAHVVIVGGDEVLDAALGRHGLPRPGAGGPAPASTGLLRLALEAAFEPMDPGDLHALLCFDPGPVPRRVAWKLVGALGKLPGRRSSLWRQAMAEGLERCDESWRGAVQARLELLLMPVAPRDGPAPLSEIQRRLVALGSWARGRADVSPTLGSLAQLAARACWLLEAAAGNTVTLLQLRRLCDEVAASAAAGAVTAEAGLASVAAPGAVLGPAEVIVWWGFTRASARTPARVRLSREERASLATLGLTPPDAGVLMEAEAARWRRPLEMAARALLLVCPATDEAGERAFPHPLWDELRALMPEPRDAARLEVSRLAAPRRVQVASRPLPVAAVTVRAAGPVALRELESPSSLEQLFGCSVAWALHYHGRVRAGLSAGPRSPTPLLLGTLAHQLLAQVFRAGALGADDAAARAAAVFDAELLGLCESLGLPRYQVEKAALRAAVLESARELGRLLAATGAQVRGVEVEMRGEVAGIQVRGIADLVLGTPEVVLDLKWGRTTNRHKLVTGTALQLALYGELFASGGASPEVGYFILNRQELLGHPGSRLPEVRVPGTATVRDTWQAARARLEARRAELASGLLAAPGADGTEVEPRIDGGRLVLAPACAYCALGGLCGRGGWS